MNLEESLKDPIALHVIVVGFHHKKGMQIEFAYPPFNSGKTEYELPDKWKHIPSLCLPDGAHNHEADTIYFHLPHLTLENQTVFGVSCYRQINAEKVANKTEDITRNTVQKSVCVLTTLPIYGYVQERLRVTTKVYFKEADFTDVRDLEGLYHDMNNTNWKDKLMHGICATESVRLFGRNILVIFKLMLLERRILFYHSPVGPLVRTITSLLALLPALLPNGLCQAASMKNICDDIIVDENKHTKGISELDSLENSIGRCEKDETVDPNNEENFHNTKEEEIKFVVTATPNPSPSEPGYDAPLSPTSGLAILNTEGIVDPENSSLKQECEVSQHNLAHEKYANLDSSECGLPLNIFNKGNLVHPYLSLQYLDVLNSVTTRAFVVGVSNTLFLHKKNLYDVLIHVGDGRIEIFDPELKKQLSLSTEDLRFAENIVRQVQAVLPSSPSAQTPSSPSHINNYQPNDVYQEGVGWLGGEEWLRHQFKIYLLSLMRSSMCDHLSREWEVYNSSYIDAWKSTHNYRMWVAGGHYPCLEELDPGHPNTGNLSMNDMKIRLAHTFHGLDKNRKINQTIANTGTVVVKTKEAVGEALSSAKISLTNFWSSFSTAMSTPEGVLEEPPADEAVEAMELNDI